MKILVTGAGGFVGGYLAAGLAGAGYSITAMWHRNRERLPAKPTDLLEFVQADIADAKSIDAIFDGAGGFDAVIHAAALVGARQESPAYLQSAVRANLLAQANLLAAAGRTGCKLFIFTSTISVYGTCSAPDGGYREADSLPDTYYGWSKQAAEGMLEIASQRHDIASLSLRLAGVHGLGRRSGGLYALAQAALSGEELTVDEPDSLFRWLFIDDVLQAVVKAIQAELPVGHNIANLASADVFTLRDLALRIKQVTGSKSTVLMTAGDRRDAVMNIDAAKHLLDYLPTLLSDFLPTYIDGLRNL